MERKTPLRRAPEFALLPLMFELGRLIRGELAKSLAPLSLLHFETLRFVAEAGEPSMRDISAYLKVAAPTATAIIDTLVRDRVLVRHADANDRRKVRLTLSPAGVKLLAQGQRARVRAFSRVVAPLSQGERTALARIIAVLTNRT